MSIVYHLHFVTTHYTQIRIISVYMSIIYIIYHLHFITTHITLTYATL